MAPTGGRRQPPVVVIALALAVVAGLLTARLVGGDGADTSQAPAVPASGVGATEVALSADAMAHPAGQAVRALMQNHFDSINAKNYAMWKATVVPLRATRLPPAEWSNAYASTADGSVRITRIEPLVPGRLLVLMSFISTQDPSKAPDGSSPRVCWDVAYPVIGSPPVIDVARGESSLFRPC